MTTKEASWVAKNTANGTKVRLLHNGIECVNITDDDIKGDLKYFSENNFANPFSGIYIWYDKNLTVQYSMCVKDIKTNSIYQCNISNLEVMENEK